MAAFPSFESILLDVHQSLAPHGGAPIQTVQKNRYAQLDKPLAGHIQMTADLLADIFEKLGLTPGEAQHALEKVMEIYGFHRELELETWTYDADARQIAWELLGRDVAPGLGRALAFWDLEGRTDTGMPGGAFWFLPQMEKRDEGATVTLPVTHVIEWLLDLLGQSIYTIGDETFRRNLYKWSAGQLPDNTSIGAYFSDVAKFDFRGAFVDDPAQAPEARIACARAFVAHKSLDAARLRIEIAMPGSSDVESVLDGSAPPELALRFVALLAERYAVPPLATIRRRLYAARMMQNAYERLLGFLCPGVDKHDANPERNKVLQLVWIFQLSYNLTIAAGRQEENEVQADAWFENQLPPWLAAELFLSIRPSLRDRAAIEVGQLLTSRFVSCKGGESLEDLFPMPGPESEALIRRNMLRLESQKADAVAGARLQAALAAGESYAALQECSYREAVHAVADDPGLPYALRCAAIERLQAMPSNSQQALDPVIAALHLFLNNDRSARPDDSCQRVAALLEQAQASPLANRFEAVILQYEAKHRLAMNDFEGAQTHFNAALDACRQRAYGSLRGEIARDAFALAVATRPLHQNDERYFRLALFYGQIQGRALTRQDAAPHMADYFWEDLYRPYAGFETELPPLRQQVEALLDEPMTCIEAGDWDKFTCWMERHHDLKNKRLRDVRGDTVVTMWLKMFHEIVQANVHRKRLRPDDVRTAMKRAEYFRHWRKAIGLIARKWVKLLDMADFKGQTPLMLAADAGENELVRVFLEAGADPNRQDFLGRSALHSAVTAHSWPSAKLLLDARINAGLATEEEQNNALHTAAKMGNPTIVAGLVAYAPALKDRRNARKQTPAMVAEEAVRDIVGHARHMAAAKRVIGSTAHFEGTRRLLA